MTCGIGTYFPMTTYVDINEAFKWCELYNTTCCCWNCGCKFIVEEIFVLPLVFTQNNTTTYQPAYTPYIINNAIWYYNPSDYGIASGTTTNYSITATTPINTAASISTGTYNYTITL